MQRIINIRKSTGQTSSAFFFNKSAVFSRRYIIVWVPANINQKFQGGIIMTSLHFVFNTKIKHPEELAAHKKQRYLKFNPEKFDVKANAKERHDIQALIDELKQNNHHDALVDCLPMGLTSDGRHTMLMDIYRLNLTVSQIQAIIKKHYPIVAEDKTPTVKLNDRNAEFQIEIIA